MTPTQKIGRKRSQRTELSRSPPEGGRSLRGPSSPHSGGGAGRRASGPGRRRSAAVRPASGGWPSRLCGQRLPTPHSAQKVFKELQIAGSQSASSQRSEHPTPTPIPGAASSGVRTRFRAAAPLPVCGEAALRTTPAEPERGCLVASLSPLFLRSFSPSPLPGPCRCPRSLYTCWGSPGWALDVNFLAWQRNKQLPRPWKGGPWRAGGGFPGRG